MQHTNEEYENKLLQIEEKLKKHFLTYDITNPNVTRKIDHTFKTKMVNDQIAKSLGLTGRDLYLSNVIALFHDYARFEQVKKFNTYNDLNSIDHGDLGAKLLIEEGEINNFIDDLTDEEKEIVRLAVKNHNKFAVEEGVNPRQLLFCNIIRDADKVDIFRIGSNGSMPMNSNFEPLTDEDIKSFKEQKLKKRQKKETFYSTLFSNLCFIFDLNFKKSFEIIYKNNYIRDFKYFIMLWSDFSIDPIVFDCFDEAISYVKQKSQED